MKGYDKVDPAVVAVIDSVKNEYKIMGSRVIGHSDAFLAAKKDNGEWIVRNDVSGIGDFLSDAFRVVLGTDIAVMGGGSIRSNMKDGEITFNDIYSVFPFENTAGVATMSGQKVLDMLEFSASASPVDFGGFLHPSGITFDIDNKVESPVVVDVNKTFLYIDNGPRRVGNVKVLDSKTGEYVPIDPAATYTVAGSNYLLRDNGDGYAVLNGVQLNDIGALDTQIVEQYISEYLGGNIPARYAKPENRIKFK
jgi:5''-nucleotidase/2'',3''-cyclic phosphodiesterase and related esterases